MFLENVGKESYLPCGESPEGNREARVKRRAGRTQRKNKNLLGLVSNLQPLSTHQRKTAYGKGTVRGCLLKRITALKGSEAKQQYGFRCSHGVMRRVDFGGYDTTEDAQALKNTPLHLFIYSSIHLVIAFYI